MRFDHHSTPYLLGLILVVGFALRVWNPSSIYFNIHAERDWWRASQVVEQGIVPYMGAELSLGGRTPGGILYLLHSIPLLFSLDPRALLAWLALLHAGALALTFQIGREHFSERVGLAAAGLFSTFPLAVISLRFLWNPCYIFPFAALFYWALADWVLKRRATRLPWLALSLAVLLQVHLSALFLVATTLACAATFRPPVSRRTAIAAAIIVVVLFAPYAIGDGMNGFSNTRKFFGSAEQLETANDAEIRIPANLHARLNIGAMKALQVVLAPVFYDMRFETGAFSHLHLLGQFGPMYLPSSVFRVAFLLHRIRWLYVLGTAAFVAGLILGAARRDRFTGKLLDARPDGEISPRGEAAFWLLCFAVPIAINLCVAVLSRPTENGVIGVGVPRYFFVLYPIPFLLWGLLARWIYRLGLQWPRGSSHPGIVVACLASIIGLQGFVVAAHLATARKTGRSIKYSLHEAYDWTTQRRAADVLVREWGVTPEQYSTRLDSLDDLFYNTHYSSPTVEQSLDWAYFTHPDLDVSAPARHPDDYFVVYDSRRTPEEELRGLAILEKREIGSFVLLRVADGKDYGISPLRNMWVRIQRPRRLNH